MVSAGTVSDATTSDDVAEVMGAVVRGEIKGIAATVVVGVAIVVVVLGFMAFRVANPWFGGWEDAAISDTGDVALLGDGSSLSVPTGCHENQAVELSETPEEVRLLLRVRGGSRGDCNHYVEVELREPLGDRPVVDVHAGRVVTTVG